jgi:hypothetical protein
MTAVSGDRVTSQVSDQVAVMHKCRARVVTYMYIAVNGKLGYVVCLWTLN